MVAVGRLHMNEMLIDTIYFSCELKTHPFMVFVWFL